MYMFWFSKLSLESVIRHKKIDGKYANLLTASKFRKQPWKEIFSVNVT